MWIKRLNLRNVYTFGDDGTPELCNFNQLNLFIGKNGSGKSNVFRALCDIDVIPIYRESTNSYTHYLGNSARRRSYVRDFTNDQLFSNETGVDLLIEYEDDIVEFKDNYHIRGNFLSKSGDHILPDDSMLSFKDRLHDLSRSKNWPATLSFSLTYIFERDFSIRPGDITEFFTKQGGSEKGTNGGPAFLNQWSSGFFSVANLLIKTLSSEKRIICIDEPETHLEPRIIRRLIDVLVWISLRHIKNKSTDISEIEKEWDSWFENSTWKDSPGWEETEPRDIKPKQIFISSHSPVMINEFISRKEICSIYDFDCSYVDSSYITQQGNENKKVEQVSLISSIRAIDKQYHGILNNLGAQGSDLIQSNGIVWVEGPSDIIYIRKWLEMYANENELTPLTQGHHYEFQMFGGTLLDSLCCIKDGLSEYVEFKKLVSIFSFSRNAYLITDSDAIKKENVIIDQSKFSAAKDFFANEFDALLEDGYKLGLWYKRHDTEVRTLEDYLDSRSLEENGSLSSTTKKLYALKVTNSWDEERKLNDFKNNLNNEIHDLDAMIRSWNE
ncbi:AAA family ATPase [Photobacterium lipolyticum]|uniref:ATPase AAA-type core domain-containing protein n=1 Tax=Photobacterium lipolyticum TaxID=266810 RepID=A0A2T3N1D5_9GAMM|nr:AAA family ATPase [Photobacterium lipolyticum]PSW06081.1 hypothetical protein C9I89_06095 [Photobacterium lipolyticum]